MKRGLLLLLCAGFLLPLTLHIALGDEEPVIDDITPVAGLAVRAEKILTVKKGVIDHGN